MLHQKSLFVLDAHRFAKPLNDHQLPKTPQQDAVFQLQQTDISSSIKLKPSRSGWYAAWGSPIKIPGHYRLCQTCGWIEVINITGESQMMVEPTNALHGLQQAVARSRSQSTDHAQSGGHSRPGGDYDY